LLGTTGRTETPTDYAGVDRSTLTTRPRSGVLLHWPTPHTTRWDDDSDDSWPVGGCWSMGNAAATAGAAGPSTVTASPLEQSTAGYALGVTVPGYVWCTKPHILPPTVAGEELSRRAHTSGARGARPAVGRCMRGAVATRHENALGSLRSRLAGCGTQSGTHCAQSNAGLSRRARGRNARTEKRRAWPAGIVTRWMLHASRRRIQPSAVQASRGSAFRFCEFANPHVTIFKEKRKKLKN
jgi:hypothetical protein